MILLLAGGVIAAVVVFAVVLSSASFTAESRSPDNSLAAGTASLTVSPDDTIIDASSMKPNSVRSGDVTVTNTGLARDRQRRGQGHRAPSPALAAALIFKIAKQGDPGVVPYNGPLGGAGRVDLGTHDTDQSTLVDAHAVVAGHRRPRAREQAAGRRVRVDGAHDVRRRRTILVGAPSSGVLALGSAARAGVLHREP